MPDRTAQVQEFEEILDRISFDPGNLEVVNADEHVPLFNRLFEIIALSNGGERYLIKMFLSEKTERKHKLLHWVLREKIEDDPERYVRLGLMKLAIRDGSPDFRDDLLALIGWWELAQEYGLDAEKLFHEAAAYGGGWLFEEILNPQRRAEIIGG